MYKNWVDDYFIEECVNLNCKKMDKDLYYQIEDNGDIETTVLTIEDCFEIMKAELEAAAPDNEQQFLITPIWLTKDEFQALPEQD